MHDVIGLERVYALPGGTEAERNLSMNSCECFQSIIQQFQVYPPELSAQHVSAI